VYIYRTIYDVDLPGDWGVKCASGDPSVGCVACKKALVRALVDYFEDFRNRRSELLGDKTELDRLLENGAERARERAAETMISVRKAMNMYRPEI